MKKMRTIVYSLLYTLALSSPLVAMHPCQVTLPGAIPETPIMSPSPIKPPLPYESLYPQEDRTKIGQDDYDPESCLLRRSRSHSMNFMTEHGNIFFNGETRTNNSGTDKSLTDLITNTSRKMLSEMHRELKKTGNPIQENLNEMRTLLKEMKTAQKRQRNLSYISYGIACATTSYIAYKNIVENQ